MVDFVDQRKVVCVSIAIILFVLAFLAPAAIIYPIKIGFITGALFIGTTQWAILTGGVGIMALATIFLAIAISKNTKVTGGVAILLSTVAAVGLMLSIKDYYYVTDNHFVSNGPFSFEEKVYEWDDFESVEERLSKENGITFVETVILRMKNGDQLEYKGGQMSRMHRTISNKVVDAGGELIRIEAPSGE